MANENPFADMECDWENVDKAKPGMSTGRLPVHHAYRGACVAFDDGAGNMVDSQLLQPAGKNPGVKLSFEILDPEKIEEETVKGKTHEHVFWISPANWPYVKRDVETITGIVPKNPQELLKMVWAGHTVEFGLKDDNFGGFLRSKVSHFNAWAPEKGDEKKTDESKNATKKVDQKGASGGAKAAGVKTASTASSGGAKGAAKSNVDF